MRDGYNTARIQLIRDDPIEQHEFDGLSDILFREKILISIDLLDLVQLNRDTYNRVRHWFDTLDAYRKTLIMRQLEVYPPCDDLTEGSSKFSIDKLFAIDCFLSFSFLADGPSWAWIMLNLLPIEQLLQYTALASRSCRIRLQMINDTMNFLLNQAGAGAAAAAAVESEASEAVPSTTDEQES